MTTTTITNNLNFEVEISGTPFAIEVNQKTITLTNQATCMHRVDYLTTRAVQTKGPTHQVDLNLLANKLFDLSLGRLSSEIKFDYKTKYFNGRFCRIIIIMYVNDALNNADNDRIYEFTFSCEISEERLSMRMDKLTLILNEQQDIIKKQSEVISRLSNKIAELNATN